MKTKTKIAIGMILAAGLLLWLATGSRPYLDASPDAGVSASSLRSERQGHLDVPVQENAGPDAPSRGGEFSLESSLDFSKLKSHYEVAAKEGDPKARRTLARIYEFCGAYSLSPEQFAAQLDALALIRPESKSQLDSVRRDVEERCRKLDDGLPITKDLIDMSWAEAVAARDPVATIRVAAQQEDLDVAGMDQLVSSVLRDADPETLFEIGVLFGRRSDSAKYAKFADPYLGQHAWQVLACRRGGESFCGVRSPMMIGLCVNGICNGMGYEQSVMFALPVADQQRLNSLIFELERFISRSE